MRTAIIDSDSLLFICLYSKKGDSAKTLEECKSTLDEMIKNILNFTKASHYILTLTIGKNFRYQIRDDYKANRKGNRPDYFHECRDYLISEYGAISNDSLESDDLVNIFQKNIPNSFICACDSDIVDGLEGTHFNYRTFKWVTTNQSKAHNKFWGDMIVGTHNGIAGLKGKGVKYWDKICMELGHIKEYREIVLSEYVNFYGEEEGVEEFYKNYFCLKIKDKWEGIEIPIPREFVKKEMNVGAEENK